MTKVLLAALCYSVLFIGIEILTRKTKLNKELSRKIVHIVAGTTVALLPNVMNFTEIMILGLLFIPVMLISKKKNIFSSIHEVSRSTHGEVYFPIAIALTALLFPHKYIFMYGMLVMALGDGLASVIGQKYGKRKYRLWQGEKSYVGSFVFFIVTIVVGLLTLSVLPLWAVIVSAAALTLIEASLSGGIDNLVVPPVAATFAFVAIHLINAN